ncbi:hypothetical protein [Paraburkholderia bannensis]|uniref:hypothetical protein n=1 Tax=Paraburkholderia bannensis TaxID=765414 RepID=UPI002AB77810|nr:hypothetical protein [Paraburkholderia bannensis]
MAHTFGAVTNTAYSETHDAILPLLMIIFGRPNYGLVVATFFDEERAFEAPDVVSRWNATKVKDETGSLVPRGALAIMFHELIAKPRHEAFTKQQVPEELLHYLAQTLGVEIKLDHAKGSVQFRDCHLGF